MPQAPAQHKKKRLGNSHTQEVKRKQINKQAFIRQSKRKYATNSAQWKRIRQQHIQAHPNNTLCQHCLAKGIYTAMTDVDHVDGDTYNNEPSNLQSLCKSCHSRKTAMENNGFGIKTNNYEKI